MHCNRVSFFEVLATLVIVSAETFLPHKGLNCAMERKERGSSESWTKFTNTKKNIKSILFVWFPKNLAFNSLNILLLLFSDNARKKGLNFSSTLTPVYTWSWQKNEATCWSCKHWKYALTENVCPSNHNGRFLLEDVHPSSIKSVRKTHLNSED